MANRSNNQAQEMEDGDDFEDFGGFETADAAPAVAAAQVQAAASPWALYNPGNVSGQPDLLCAQNRFPNYLDPSPEDISGHGPPDRADVNLNNIAAVGLPPDLPQADLLGGQILGDQARIAENVLDGALNPSAGGSGFPSNHSLIGGARLPDIGLGINEDRLFHQPPNGELDAGEASGVIWDAGTDHTAAAPLELVQSIGLSAAVEPLRESLDVQGAGGADNVGGAHAIATQQNGASLEVRAERPSTSDGAEVAGEAADQNLAQGSAAEVATGSLETARNLDALQQRLTAVTEENQRLEEELSQCRSDLAAQRSRLQEMEERHVESLSEVRKAGHDALAVVAEQYKEQVKTVVLEQQEEARRQITEASREHTRALQHMLEAQQEEQLQQKKDYKDELARQISEAVEQSRQEQQELFQVSLKEELEKQREAAKQMLEEERQASQQKIEEAINIEIDRGKTRLEEAKAEASKKLEEERKSHQAALSSIREEEKKIAQDQMAELTRAERERSRNLAQEAVEASREESRAYLQEQRQADSRVRQRHLASLDLFLESSRQQIALLMEAEGSSRDSNSASTSQAAGATAGHKSRPDKKNDLDSADSEDV